MSCASVWLLCIFGNAFELPAPPPNVWGAAGGSANSTEGIPMPGSVRSHRAPSRPHACPYEIACPRGPRHKKNQISTETTIRSHAPRARRVRACILMGNIKSNCGARLWYHFSSV